MADPGFQKMLIVELWLSFFYASYNGAMVVALTEVMMVEVWTADFSLVYNLATAIATDLIEHTKDKGAPGIVVTVAATCLFFCKILFVP